MEQEQPIQTEQFVRSDRDVTEIVVSALLNVYDSNADLEVTDIAKAVQIDTGFDYDVCVPVIQKLYDEDSPHLQVSKDPNYKTMLSASGLWLIEDCFMNGEDNIDSMAIAERNLSKFVSFLKANPKN